TSIVADTGFQGLRYSLRSLSRQTPSGRRCRALSYRACASLTLRFLASGNTKLHMARLRDVPPAIRKLGPWTFFKRLWGKINQDNLFVWASAVAYSWLFAIFPFVIFLLTLLPYLPPDWKTDAKQQIKFAVDQLPRE